MRPILRLQACNATASFVFENILPPSTVVSDRLPSRNLTVRQAIDSESAVQSMQQQRHDWARVPLHVKCAL